MGHLHIKFIAQSDKDFSNCKAELTAVAAPLPEEHAGHGEESGSGDDSINADIIIVDKLPVDTDGSVIFPLPEGEIEHYSVTLYCGDEIVAASPIQRNEDGDWPKSAIVLIERPHEGKDCQKPEKPVHKCGINLKQHHALKQNRYVYISKVEQPDLCIFPSLETLEINANDRRRLEKAIQYSGELAEEAKAIEQKAAMDAYFTSRPELNVYNSEFNPVSFARYNVASGIGAAPVSAAVVPAIQSGSVSIEAAKSVDFKKATIAVNELMSPTLKVGKAQISDAMAIGALADIEQIANIPYKDLPARFELTCRHPLHWDGAQLPQSCQPFLIHVLEFVEEVIHTGYQYGKIIDTQSLLPCEDIQLASVTFRREETTSRQEKMVAVDALSASISRARDIDDLHKATVNESMRGGSSSRVGGWGVGAAIPLYGAIIGVGGGGGRSKSSSFQNSARSMTASASQRLRDSTQQASHSVRSQTVTVVNRATQEESVSAVTRSIRNHNHSRSLDLVTYEIDRCLEVRQRLAGVREGLCVPLKMTGLTDSKILRHREALEMALRNEKLRPGFDAIQRIRSNYEGVNFPTGTYADAVVNEMQGEMEFEFRISEPDPVAFDGTGHPPWFLKHPFLHDIILDQWRHRQEKRAEFWQKKVARVLARKLAKHIRLDVIRTGGGTSPLPLDFTALTQLNSRNRMRIGIKRDHTGPWPSIPRSQIEGIQVRIVDDSGSDISTDDLLPGGSEIFIRSGHVNYRTDFNAGQLFNDRRINDDLTGEDYGRVYTPMKPSEMENPKETDAKYADLLRTELNDNLPLCYEMIYTHMAVHKPSEMRMLMDRVIIPGTGGLSMRTLMGDFIGAFDGCAAFYVAPGYSLSADRLNDLLKEALGENGELDLMALYDPEIPIDPIQILLPTGATFTEASLGRCNLAEKIDHSLNVNWGEPCGNQATAINPVSLQSRRAEPADVSPTPFANPIINIQNTPAAPDYEGVGGILGAIGSKDLFRDMAGLEQTQKNALAAYNKAMDLASSSQGNAMNMWKMNKSVRDLDNLKSRLGNMVEDGTLTEGEAGGIMKDYLKNITNPNSGSNGLGSGWDGPSNEKGDSEGGDSNGSSGESNANSDGDHGVDTHEPEFEIRDGLKGTSIGDRLADFKSHNH